MTLLLHIIQFHFLLWMYLDITLCGNNYFSLYKSNHLVGFSTLINSLYNLKLDRLFSESLLTVHHIVGMKRNMINKNSSFLCHDI